MSLQLIQAYHHKVQEILQYGGSRNETAIRPAFQKLLEQYCADKKIELILELEYRPAQGAPVRPDGTLKVIDLLQRVCTVSVETMNVIGDMTSDP